MKSATPQVGLVLVGGGARGAYQAGALKYYEDAKRCLEPIVQTFSSVQAQRQSHHSLINLTAQLLNDPLL
ncbi:hypothetical protein [Allocoleopsis franciscana]|uniref:Uncharacterized protein n=1 Tax=Allocoleopsis franciscana PCC 7113 TaxID=1173027 RepID=K9WMN2_9CYAN|nr:hypothetical protein [Allocoleopsis franciscana]AFZ21655.1 hypothetical protein Mic7113_6056 [Allocoleopsis franciscana PCC 7113]